MLKIPIAHESDPSAIGASNWHAEVTLKVAPNGFHGDPAQPRFEARFSTTRWSHLVLTQIQPPRGCLKTSK